MVKQEILHVFHMQTDDTLTISTTIDPSNLIFWEHMRKGCVVVEGQNMIAYGDFRCVVDIDHKKAVILATTHYLGINGSNE